MRNYLIFGLLLIIFLAGCDFAGTTDAVSSGFGGGVWHGLLAPYTLIIRFFIPVQMYQFPNSGVDYDLGFLIGVGFSLPLGWMAVVIALITHFGFLP